MADWSPLANYLKRAPQTQQSIRLTFLAIEKLLGRELKRSAYEHRAYWGNDRTHSHAWSWLNVGWRVQGDPRSEKAVNFVRGSEPDTMGGRKPATRYRVDFQGLPGKPDTSPDFTLDVGAVKSGIRRFNSSQSPFYLAEVALHQVFVGPLEQTAVPLRVLAVNSFWNANVDKEPGALFAICERLRNNIAVMWHQAGQVLSDLRLPSETEADQRAITQCAAELLPILLGAAGFKRVNYSFATKFLHWSFPEALPIVDNFSARTITKLGKSRGWPSVWVPTPNDRATESKCVEEYGRVIALYNAILLSMPPLMRKQLTDVDFESQPQGYRHPNTLLRILDKYFWIEEKLPGLMS